MENFYSRARSYFEYFFQLDILKHIHMQKDILRCTNANLLNGHIFVMNLQIYRSSLSLWLVFNKVALVWTWDIDTLTWLQYDNKGTRIRKIKKIMMWKHLDTLMILL